MELEEAIKLLKEMQENCKNKTIYKDEKAEAKAEAIERVLRCCETSNENISREIDNLRACFHEGVEKRNLKIDYLLKELDKKDKEIEYLKKNQRYKKDFNGEKIFCLEYDKETLRDMVLEKQEEIKELKSNSIPKDKIREIIKELRKRYFEEDDYCWNGFIFKDCPSKVLNIKEDIKTEDLLEKFEELLKEE